MLGVNASCNCCLLIRNQCSDGDNKSYIWVSCREALDKWRGRGSCSIWSEMCNFLFRFYESLSIIFADESWGLLSPLRTESCGATTELVWSRLVKVLQPWISRVRSTADAVMFRYVAIESVLMTFERDKWSEDTMGWHMAQQIWVYLPQLVFVFDLSRGEGSLPGRNISVWLFAFLFHLGIAFS